MLKGLVACLEPIEILATNIGGRDVDLLLGDWMMIQTINELEKKGTSVADVMAESLVVRYVHRRSPNNNLLNLMKFLKGGNAPQDDTSTYSLPPGNLIK